MSELRLIIELDANPLDPSPLFPILANSDTLTRIVWLPLCLSLWVTGLVVPYVLWLLWKGAKA